MDGVVDVAGVDAVDVFDDKGGVDECSTAE